MKLLITGGSGTLGQEITNLALAKKYQVHIPVSYTHLTLPTKA